MFSWSPNLNDSLEYDSSDNACNPLLSNISKKYLEFPALIRIYIKATYTEAYTDINR